jgi:hypothetical protein
MAAALETVSHTLPRANETLRLDKIAYDSDQSHLGSPTAFWWVGAPAERCN